MRSINVDIVKKVVSELCLKANFELRGDVLKAIKKALKSETSVRARGILKLIIENADLARRNKVAICQDTGIVFVHLKIGQDAHFAGGSLIDAVNRGVRDAYKEGYLRRSVVADALLRVNTGTNTPAVISTDIVPGDKVNIYVSPKGFGSENKSRIIMLAPTSGEREIKDFIINTVMDAGPDACPPLVLGIGIGGTFELAALLAKKALMRPIGSVNPKRHFAGLERDIMSSINSIGIGPMGLGGKTTVLGVNILEYPTHIAGLPVAVNISCHATRGASTII